MSKGEWAGCIIVGASIGVAFIRIGEDVPLWLNASIVLLIAAAFTTGWFLGDKL